ncbi:MAG: type III pantothenate kinase [Betaproteobacteria bacterium]|nr:type III pantothenate kinase [Betaproteobacteria bacterium]
MLLVDLGNSRLKWSMHHGPRVVRGVLTLVSGNWDALRLHEDWSNALSELGCRAQPLESALCSSADEERTNKCMELLVGFCQRPPERLRTMGLWELREGFNHVVLRNDYTSPQQLGDDRWVLAMGLAATPSVWPDKSSWRISLVSAGTATVIDYVEGTQSELREGFSSLSFRGGFILPGFAQMRGALLTSTSEVAPRWQAEAGLASQPGLSTAEGVERGLAMAQLGPLTMMGRPDAILVTGGGASEFLAAYRSLLEPQWWLAAQYLPTLMDAGLRAGLESLKASTS